MLALKSRFKLYKVIYNNDVNKNLDRNSQIYELLFTPLNYIFGLKSGCCEQITLPEMTPCEMYI